MKCHGCGIEKDPAVHESYPYPDDGIITNEPVEPLFHVDCAPGSDSEPCATKQPWRTVTVCHHCFHRLSPDMWIDQRVWESINPATPFSDLPALRRTPL